MKKTVLAVVVATVATMGAAHATNVDVINFVNKAQTAQTGDHNAYQEAKNAYDNLNARDRMVADAYYSKAGISTGLYKDIVTPAHAANVPAGWDQQLTRNQILTGSTHPERELHAAPAPAPVAGVVSYESQLKQLQSSMFQAIKIGSVPAQEYIKSKIDALNAEHGKDLTEANYARTSTQHPDHFVPQGSQKVEDASLKNGDQRVRSLVNLVENREAQQHEARFGGMLHEAPSIYEQLDAENAAKRAAFHADNGLHAAPKTGADAGAVSYENQLKQLNEQMIQAIKAGDQGPAQAVIKAKIDALQKDHAAAGTQVAIAGMNAKLASGATTAIDAGDADHVAADTQATINSINTKLAVNRMNTTLATGGKTAIDTTDADHVAADTQATIKSINTKLAVNRMNTTLATGGKTAIDTTDADHVAADTQATIKSINTKLAVNRMNTTLATGGKTAIDTNDADHVTAAGNPTPVNASEYRTNVNNNVAAKAGNPAPVNASDYKIAATMAQVDQVKRDAAQTKAQDAQRITTAEKYKAVEFNTLQAGINQAQATGEYAQARADSAYKHAAENREALRATNSRVAKNSAAIADHESRIQSLESTTTSKFGQLKSEVDQNRKRASAGIAGVAAMANIPQVIQGQTFSVGAGVGNTDGESALAVGMSARASENVVVKASVSNDTQHNFVVGAGVSYGW